MPLAPVRFFEKIHGGFVKNDVIEIKDFKKK